MSYYKPVTTIASVGTASTPIPVTIASATEPTTRENGGTLRQGDDWYNTSTDAAYIWIENPGETGGGSWKIIGSGASGPKTITNKQTLINTVTAASDIDTLKSAVLDILNAL
jgi:hypothetical protein